MTSLSHTHWVICVWSVSSLSCCQGDMLPWPHDSIPRVFFLGGGLSTGGKFVCACACVCVSGCMPGQVLGRQTCWKWVKDTHKHRHAHIHTLGGDYVVPSARLEHSVVWLIRPGTLMDEHTQPANKHTHSATCDAIDAQTHRHAAEWVANDCLHTPNHHHTHTLRCLSKLCVNSPFSIPQSFQSISSLHQPT